MAKSRFLHTMRTRRSRPVAELADALDCDVGNLQSRKDRAALYQPKSLDDKTREHVQRAVRIRKALPAFKVDRRTEKKPLAPSVQKSAFKDWLGSEEGKQWASDRARIWAPPELGAEDDAS
ncbi:unnamed protein product [Durusdinium trenchii]|uniref:Uncharacterized protein n=1 Tax=Durusdinium trenchii TaxID=1381693 RepID=A0ABP0T1H1_9DINO